MSSVVKLHQQSNADDTFLLTDIFFLFVAAAGAGFLVAIDNNEKSYFLCFIRSYSSRRRLFVCKSGKNDDKSYLSQLSLVS